MRSTNHPTYYHVGSWRGRAVYWHPMLGYAREEDHSQLVELKDLSEVVWFDDQMAYEQIVAAVEASHGKLREAMCEQMQAELEAIRRAEAADAARWAEDCEQSKQAALRDAAGVF